MWAAHALEKENSYIKIVIGGRASWEKTVWVDHA